MIQLPIRPEEAAKIVLRRLPTKRMRDVIEKRYGLKGGRRKTLDAIGKEYSITRERVRQIETDALRHLGKGSPDPELEPFYRSLGEHIKHHGRVMAENHLFSTLGYRDPNPHLVFLLHVGGPFSYHSETDSFHKRWSVDASAVAAKEGIIERVVADLDKHKRTLPERELMAVAVRQASEESGEETPEHVARSYITSSKLISKNPYGEYGLSLWSSVHPRGVRDKAFLVFEKSGKPLHFREVADAINKAGWGKRKAHPQTVHNELIKDPRFVLVGRGLYALREWGYEPGTVSDAIVAVLKRTGKSLTKNEIIQQVLKKRMVKTPTVMLNLQNRSLFRRTGKGKYTLA